MSVGSGGLGPRCVDPIAGEIREQTTAHTTIPILNLNQIRYFLHLAETLNFTEAARRSGVSQPGFTKAIQCLEEELEGRLIYRDGKDTRLTALGRDVLAEFMRIDLSLRQVCEVARNSVRGRHRAINIGVATTVTAGSFARFFESVLRQLPHVELRVHPMLPGEDEASLFSGKYDAMILARSPCKNVKLATHILYRERYRIGCSLEHPFAKLETVDPSQLPDETYVDRNLCEFHSEIVNFFVDRDILMRPRFSSDREDWVQCFVANTQAICIIPERSSLSARLVTRPVKGLDVTRNIVLATVSGSGTPVELRHLFKLAKAYDWTLPVESD